MTTHRTAALALTLCLAACSSASEDSETSPPPEATGAGAAKVSTGPSNAVATAPADSGLFACGFTPSCTIYDHMGPPAEEMACVASLIGTGAGKGVALLKQRYGGGCIEHDELFVMRGDGKILHETRKRDSARKDPEYSCGAPVPWQTTGAELCDPDFFQGDHGTFTDCAPRSEACRWRGVKNCAPVEPQACAELTAALASPGR